MILEVIVQKHVEAQYFFSLPNSAITLASFQQISQQAFSLLSEEYQKAWGKQYVRTGL